MTDIGVPGYTPPPQGGSDANELAMISRGVAGALSGVAEGLKESKLSGVREDLKTIASEGLEAEASATGPEVDIVFSRAGEQELYDNLRRWSNQVNQSDGSTRAAVINRAKRAVTSAIARNPSLRDGIRAEFNMFMSTNPDLDALGLQDQTQSAEAALAQGQLNMVKERAYGDPGEPGKGGLGIDPAIPFMSERFVKEYVARSAGLAEAAESTLLVNNLTAASRLDVLQAEPAVRHALNGVNNAVDATFSEFQSRVATVAQARRRLATSTGSQADQDLVIGWEEGGLKDAYLSELSAYNAALDEIENKMSISQRSTREGEAMLETLNSARAYIGRWVTAAEQMADSPNLVSVMETEAAYRKMNFTRQYPEVAELGQFLRETAVVWENADTLDLSDTKLTNLLGHGAVRTLEDALARSLLFAPKTAGPTAEEISDHARRMRVQDPAPYGAGADSQQRGQAATEYLRQSNMLASGIANNFDGIDVPKTVANQYITQVADLQELTEGKWFDDTTRDLVAESYTTEDFEKAAKKLKAGENAEVMAALGDELQAYWVAGDPAARINQHAQSWNKLRDYVDVDMSTLASGQVSWTMKPGAGEKLATARGQIDPLAFRSGTVKPKGSMERQLQRDAQKFFNTLNQDLKFVGNFRWLVQPALKEPNYAVTFTNEGFASIFGEPLSE